MKKLIPLLGLALLAPQLVAAPGCGFYWGPIVSFFNAGGEVIIDPEHYPYTVNANNVNATNQYVIRQGMEVIVYYPDCGSWTWGMGVSCPCNEYGSNTCQLPGTPLGGTGMKWGRYIFSTVCNCPNGSSYWGIALESAKYCGPPPPP
jgi:hypothetical protein